MTSARDEALAALGLAGRPDAGREEVLKAFKRLARRYPPRSFPERFERIIAARDLLLGDERYWREQVLGRTLDLGWARPYLPPDPIANAPEPTPRESLQGFLRAAYRGIPLEDAEEEEDEKALFERLLESLLGRGGR
jgi:curved DNA-binding protein CbpA